MKIAAIRHAVPSQPITNAWVIRRIREENRSHLPSSELQAIEQTVDEFLAAAGTEVRYQLAEGERAIDFVVRAGREALQAGGAAPGDVDFLIYTGVGRGWVEPAMGTVVQAELGLTNATCFDVLDACASWLRALHVAYSYMRSGAYRCGLIVNCECGLYRSYADWRLAGVAELGHRLAGYTIGEAATATLVVADDVERDYYFRFRTFPEHFGLCMLPLGGATDFWPGAADGRCTPHRFFALSRELLAVGTRRVVEVFESDSILRQRRYDVGFGHSASEKVCALVARKLGLADVFFPTHRDFGNTVSASVPLGMSLALERGRLQREQSVLLVVGSAGITVGLAAFRF
jgi:3-oxoacyl-[acyl-carrier-protein] synthase III